MCAIILGPIVGNENQPKVLLHKAFLRPQVRTPNPGTSRPKSWDILAIPCLNQQKQVTLHTIRAKIITLHNFVVSNSFPRLRNKFSHYRIGFESISGLCNFLRCCDTYHVDVGVHYIIFKLFYQLCNSFFTLQTRFRINYVIISAVMVMLCPGFPRARVRDIPTSVWVPDVPGLSCPKALSFGCFLGRRSLRASGPN